MLHVHITRLDGTKSEIDVEAPVERVEREIDAVCRKYRQELQIPGFRKGKAPLSLIRARFRTAIQGEVVNDLVPRLYEEAQEQEHLMPLSRAEIKDIVVVISRGGGEQKIKEKGHPLKVLIRVAVSEGNVILC